MFTVPKTPETRGPRLFDQLTLTSSLTMPGPLTSTKSVRLGSVETSYDGSVSFPSPCFDSSILTNVRGGDCSSWLISVNEMKN